MLATIDPYILAFSSITVIVTIWMGFRSAKTSKTASDFFVAGRSVSVGWNASAISGEYLSAASFMGIAGMVMSSGYDALWYPVCYACGYLFLLLFIAGPLRRFGAYTIPDFAEGRFDSPLFRKIAVCFVLFIGFFYTMPQMKGAGTTLSYIFQDVDLRGGWFEFLAPHNALGEAIQGFPYWAGVLIVGAVITLNVALGGMKGITLVQAFQYWAKMFAISVPIFVLMAVYGHYGRQLEVNGNNQQPTTKIEHRMEGKVVAASLDVGSSTLEVRRSPLPEKAPKDETWLSPFGPLTTKAAKAAEIKLRSESTDELFQVMNYSISGTSDTNTLALAKAKATDLLERYIMYPTLSIGEQPLAGILVEFTKTRRVPVLLATSLAKDGGAWMMNNALITTTASGRTTEIDAGFSNANAGLIFASEATIVVPLSRKLEFQKLYDAKGIAPFNNGPVNEQVLKTQQKNYSLLYTYSLIIALVCGTAGLPHILVRFYTNPDGVAAKRTTMWVMILIGIFYVFPPVFGVMGRNLFPELYNGIGAKGTDKIVLELPRLLNEKYAPLGSILSGITCAGAFAAFMSTFSGLLVSMTGALAHDVYGRMLRPKSTPEQRMRMFKFAAVLIGGVSILLGSFVEPLEINFMVGQAFAIAAASYFPLLFMSVWWRGMTMKGAAVGMLTGGLCALIAAAMTNISNLALDKGPMGKLFSGFAGMNDFWAQHPLLRILCEQPAIWTVPLAITLMIVVSKATRKDVPSDVRMKMLVLHAPEKLGLKQEYIQEHQAGH